MPIDNTAIEEVKRGRKLAVRDLKTARENIEFYNKKVLEEFEKVEFLERKVDEYDMIIEKIDQAVLEEMALGEPDPEEENESSKVQGDLENE